MKVKISELANRMIHALALGPLAETAEPVKDGYLIELDQDTVTRIKGMALENETIGDAIERLCAQALRQVH